MNRIILFTLGMLITTFSYSQTKKPKRIIKTEVNKNDNCLMPIFEIQDASDVCDNLLLVNNVEESKLLLAKLNEHLEWFDLFKENCNCLRRFENEFFLFFPDMEISEALKLNELDDINKIVKQISSDVDLIWLMSSECF